MKLLSTGIAIAAAAVLSASMADGKQKVEFGGGADVVSKYVWRGQLLTDDPVFQPYAEISSHDLTLNIWGSIDMTDTNERGNHSYRLQEMNYTLSYGIEAVDGLSLEGGVIHYSFPGTSATATSEGYITASLSELLLTPTATMYYDFDEVNGMYATIGAGHTFTLSEHLGLSLGASLGWGGEDYNKAYFGDSTSSGFNDLGLSASLDYTINEMCSLSAYARYSAMLDDDVKDASSDSDVLVAGAGIYFSY